LPLKRHRVTGRSNGSGTKIGKEARDESKKFDVALEYRVRVGQEQERRLLIER